VEQRATGAVAEGTKHPIQVRSSLNHTVEYIRRP
jgi:hypothetical protein